MLSTMKFLTYFYSFFFVLVPSVVYSLEPYEEGIAFLADNAKKPDVISLESGLQYKILTNGTGLYHPSVSSPCSCHYKGTTIDGTTFDSSYDRGEPTSFAPNQVIKGWTEAMQLMVQGDKWELYIPSELAYGERGSPPKIPGGSVLIFIMEIIQIDHDIEFLIPAMKCNIETLESCQTKDIEYIKKVKNVWTNDKIITEIKRLETMIQSSSSNKLKVDLKNWISRRILLLRAIQQQTSSNANDDDIKTKDDTSSEL